MAYFKVKNFTIIDMDHSNDNGEIQVDPILKDMICDDKYILNSDKDQHYTPENFFKMIKMISKRYPDKKLHVHYKYEYFNHDHINTFQNILSVKNCEIKDRIMG